MTAQTALRSLLLSPPVAVLLLCFAAAAGAEAFGPPPEPSAVVVQIDAREVAPLDVPVASGQRVVFRNDSSAMARIELDLERGDGVACTTAGEAPRRARKFVVPGGATLDCDAPTESVDWHVYRAGAPASEGRIEISTR